MEKKFIISVAAIIVILTIAFLSQKAYFGAGGKNLVSDATNQAGTYLSKGSDWVMSRIYPKISGEVQKRGEMIKNEVDQEKNKISESIGKKIENYFSGIAESVFHPGENIGNQNCPPVQSTQPTQTKP